MTKIEEYFFNLEKSICELKEENLKNQGYLI